ncbi:hypothetical protein Btru_011990 [Bulinus truncatus]|nr:hypothetical protein Btru_011990 [Bulinus truncatus]
MVLKVLPSGGESWNKRYVLVYLTLAAISTGVYLLGTRGWRPEVWFIPYLQTKPGDWHMVSLAEITEGFSDLTSDSCNQSCQLSHCSAVTPAQWDKVLAEASYPKVPLLSKGQYIYEFEKDYLSYPPLEDMKQLPDVKLSNVTMFGVDNDTVRCQVGDTVTGRVDLVNGYGQPRAKGGDEVRVWLVDSGTKQYRSAGQVTDFNNGSYLITAWCLWPGVTTINVAVVYPREYIRTVIHQTHLSITRFTYGKFAYNGTEETTVCWSLPNVPGRPCVCNLTHITGQSLYCGRPLNKKLTCGHWVATAVGPLQPPFNVTNSEKDLVKKVTTRSVLEFSIPHNVKLITESKGQLPALKPCSKTGTEVTWDLTSKPAGFWTPVLMWSSLQCSRPPMSTDWAAACLKDTTVHFFGDSNAIRLFNSLAAATGCGGLSNGLWPLAGSCRNTGANINMSFTPHEHPLYQHAYWTDRLGYKGVAEYINAVPSVGNFLIIVHYFLHAMLSHLSVVHSRLQTLKTSIRNLSLRNPDVLFAIRGPHVSSFEWDHNHAIGGDNLGKFYVQIIQEIFRDLRDKIVYLDGWGMSLALENADYHPTDRIPQEMIQTLLSFRCNETGYVPRTFSPH